MSALTAAAIISGLAAAGTTGYSIYSGEKQREAIDNEAGRAAARADALKKDQERLKAEAKAKEAAILTRDSQSSQVRANARTGRSGTILTSPLGATGTTAGATPGGKTLLGS